MWLIKTRRFFHITSRKQTVQGENSGMNDSRLMWLSTQNIGKDIRASSYFFTRRAADVVSEACFTATTGDRHDELAAMNYSMIAVALTPSWLVLILTVVPVWLYFS